MTDISVVMGVYNAAATLRATLDSILGQEEADLELVAVDDGSTDGTAAILDEYAARDPRVRVIHQVNLGLTRALVAGCGAARGRYIARQDAGDLSNPRRLAVQQKMLDADRDVVFVSCATQFAGPGLEPLYVAPPSGAALSAASILDLDAPHALSDGPTHHGSVMFRRDAYERAGGYRPQFYYGQDFDLWYRLATAGKFQTTTEVLYIARLDPGSITSSARGEQQRLAELSRAALQARLHGQAETAILASAAAVRPVRAGGWCRRARGLYFIGEALRRNHDRRASAYLRQAIAACPFFAPAWLRLAQALLS
jgi:glycosyltransferase involved in cell wall biosynthesis